MLRNVAKLFVCLLFLAGAFTPLSAKAGVIHAKGGASDDFQLDPELTLNDPEFLLGAVIERDRIYMSAREGWQSKHIPFSFDEAGLPYGGGLYLFDTQEDAENFASWLSEEFALDGVLILERPYFLDVKAYTYKVIGAYQFGDYDYKTDSAVVRTERWTTPRGPLVEPLLKTLWPLVVLEAHARRYVAVWMLYNEDEQIVNLVYFDDRVGPWSPPAPDFASLNALADDETMGPLFDLLHWPKIFDRTSWVLTVWYPFEAGDSGEAALWPNSPPFPAGFIGDGICVPSQGEDHATAPDDCLETCGDGVPQAGEDTANCPGDVPLE
ncbi:MAG TPA: hypothetical protein VJR29_05255 [bacterium]|nr:hypothetical protein [bacterium]